MTRQEARAGISPAPGQVERTSASRHSGDDRPAFRSPGALLPMRAGLLAILAASISLAGCIDLSFGAREAEALSRDYTRDVQIAISTLSIVFAQADESVKLVQNGWLAPEGAASQFGLLHEQVKDVRADITDAAPPPDMQGFHRQLGRSVTLTQQAMDAMQVGFSSGDASYFDLAKEKLQEARATLDRAIKTL